MTVRGGAVALAQRLEARFALALSSGPQRCAANGLALIGTGPGVWLAQQIDAPPSWPGNLAAALEEVAHVVDQSSAYVTLRLEGPAARAHLQARLAVDLHPAMFASDAAAVTTLAHLPVVLWQAEDGFYLATFRSYATDLLHALEFA